MGTTNFNQVAPLCNLSENTPPPATLGCNNNHTTTGGVSIDIRHKSKQKGGFTLVELSIVLIIIGLIVGGVLGGQSLIKSAELQRVVNELKQYSTMTAAFRLEYNAMPGDMDNATDYWGVQTDSDGTRDGNGDGYVNCPGGGDGNICTSETNGDYLEVFAYHQHLILANIFPGSYFNVKDDNIKAFKIGDNFPEMRGIGDNKVAIPSYWNAYGKMLGSIFLINAQAWHGAGGYGKSFTPKDAVAVDRKLDDGVIDTGKVLINPQYGTNGYNHKDCLANPDDMGGSFDLLAEPKNPLKPNFSSSVAACRIAYAPF